MRTWQSGAREVAKHDPEDEDGLDSGPRFELVEEGQAELLDDPEFDTRFQARLVELGKLERARRLAKKNSKAERQL
jgi:hypothetical protein